MIQELVKLEQGEIRQTGNQMSTDQRALANEPEYGSAEGGEI